MESVSELQNYRVSDLKQFLSRNNVDPATVKRSDKKNGPPRKSDLLGVALLIRADFDDPQKNGPTSPEAGRPRNIFQSGYSPRSARTMDEEVVVAEAKSKKSNTTAIPTTTTPTPKKSRKRRSSMGWVNPAFLAQLTPKASNIKTPEASASEYSQDFGDEGDHVIHSDYASSAGGRSPSDSDAGSTSVVETDDSDDEDHSRRGRRRRDDNDDEKFKSQFEGYKAYEIRAWLNTHDVKYDHRAKKKELQALAIGHALYLEANADDTDIAAKHQKAEDTDDSVQIVEDPAPSRRLGSRKSRSARKNKKHFSKGEPTETVVGIHSSRKRPSTKAPMNDDEDDVIMEAADDEGEPEEDNTTTGADSNDNDNSTTGNATNTTATDVDEDGVQVVETPVVSNVRRRKRITTRISAPKLSMPAMPRVTVTKQGLASMVFAICLVILVILGVEYWEKMNRPFCDLGSHSEFIYSANGEGKKRCAPCPAFANCANGELNCIPNYRAEGRICVEDSKVSDYANYIEKLLIRTLATAKGMNACNSKHQFSFNEDEMRNMFPEADMEKCPKSRLEYIAKRLRLDVSKFDGAFNKAMIKIKNNPEKIHWRRKTGLFEAKTGMKTIGCTIRLFIRRHFLAFLIAAIVGVALIRWRIKRYFRLKEQRRIDSVYDRALEVLREVRLHYSEEDKGDAFMRDTELREELLGRTTAESVKLWAKVEKLLASETRVLKTGPKTIKGMPCYVYEWRGNLRRPPSLGNISSRASFQPHELDNRKRLSFSHSASPHQSPILSMRHNNNSSGYEIPTSPYSNSSPAPHQHHSPPPPQYQHHHQQNSNNYYSPQDNNNNRRNNPIPSPTQPSPGYASLLNSWRNHK